MIPKFFQITKKNLRGFSLIELLVVIGIVGILVGIMVVGLKEVREKAQHVKALSRAMSIHDQLKRDLVAGWNFDEGRGDRIFDITGRHHGVIFGPNWSWVKGVPGLGGTAIRFDKWNPPIYAENKSGGLDFEGKTPFTISLWVNLEAKEWPGRKRLIYNSKILNGKTEGWRAATACPPFLHPAGEPCNQFCLERWRDGEVDVVCFSMPSVSNIWNHLIFTYDGEVMRGYLNGELKASARSTKEIKSLRRPNIFIGPTGSVGHPVPTSIDQVYIYSRALTAQEIQKLYAESAKKYKLSMTIDDDC